MARGLLATIDLGPDQPWILQQLYNSAPHKVIQIILSDWPIGAHWPAQSPIAI
jgi:hypothetical protein